MHHIRRVLRLVVEIAFVAFALTVIGYALVMLLVLHLAFVIYALPGWLLFIPLLLLLGRALPRLAARRRVLFDIVLVTLVPAFWLGIWAYDAHYPLEGTSMDWHGGGRASGHPNLFLIPWLHLVLFTLVVGVWGYFGRPRGQTRSA